MRYYDDITVQFGNGQPVAEAVPLTFQNLQRDDVLELQVTSAADDGSVQVFPGNAPAGNANALAVVAVFSALGVHRAVRFLATAHQLSIRCTNAAGPVVVIVRRYRQQ
jgi:hypothetical protein